MKDSTTSYIPPSLYSFRNFRHYEKFAHQLDTDNSLLTKLHWRNFRLHDSSGNEKEDLPDSVSMESILSADKIFLIAEPGCGKSRLLWEAALILHSSGKGALYLDLKKLKINRGETNRTTVKHIFEKTISLGSQSVPDRFQPFKTENFDLGSKTNKIILDGLDEVPLNEVPFVIDFIRELFQKYPKSNLIISCRKHHVFRVRGSNDEHVSFLQQFEFVFIAPFTDTQTREFLEPFFSSDQISTFLTLLRQNKNLSLLQIPRYLEIFTLLIQKSVITLGNSEDLNLPIIIDRFIYSKIDIEAQKGSGISNPQKAIIKSVLSKVALVMKMKDVLEISREEMVDLLSKLKGTLPSIVLNQPLIDVFFDRSLLKDNVNSVQFENTSFQEYLAANALKKLSETNAQALFDIVVDPVVRKLYPKWYETIGFLLSLEESENKLSTVEFLFGLLKQSKDADAIFSDELSLLLKVNPEILPIALRTEIFQFAYVEILRSDFNRDSYGLVQRLAIYYEQSYEILLFNTALKKELIYENNARTISTLLFVARTVLESGKQINGSFWKERIHYWLSNDTDGRLFRVGYLLAREIGEHEFFKSLLVYTRPNQRETFYDYLVECFSILGSNEFTLNLFIKGIEVGNTSVHPAIRYVNTENTCILLLEYWITNPQKFYKYIKLGKEEYRYTDTLKTFLVNTADFRSNIIQKHLESLTVSLITTKELPYSYADYGKAIIRFVDASVKYNPSFIREVIPLVVGEPNKSRFHHFYFEDFPDSIPASELIWVHDYYKLLNQEYWFMAIVNRASNVESKNVIQENWPQYLQKTPTISKTEQRKLLKQIDEVSEFREDVRRFTFSFAEEKHLHGSPEFLWHVKGIKVFDRFIEFHENIFTQFKNPRDQAWLRQFKNKTVEFVNGLNPFERRETPNLKGFEYYNLMLVAALKLEIDLSSDLLLRKILFHIPFSSSLFREELLPSVVNRFKASDKKELTAIYIKEWGKPWTIQAISSILEYMKIFSDPQFVDLIKFIGKQKSYEGKQPDMEDYYRREIITVLSKLNVEETYFKEILKITQPENVRYGTFNMLNEILITKFQDEQSIAWRINEIRKMAKPFKRPGYSGRARSVSEYEHEIDHMSFAKPLFSVNKVGFINHLINLTEHALSKIEIDRAEYAEYGGYIKRLITSYFSNLPSNDSHALFKEFEDHFVKSESSKEYSSFRKDLKEIGKQYLLKKGKEISISAAVKSLNEIEDRAYLPIQTEEQLVKLIVETLEGDLKNFIEEQGYYSIASSPGINEGVFQGTFKVAIEGFLIKRGIREIDVIRENELYDGKKIDLLVYFGQLGPIMIEVKLAHNRELTNKRLRTEYSHKLKQYIAGSKSKAGVYLIVQVKDKPAITNLLDEVKGEYASMRNLRVIGFSAYKAPKNKSISRQNKSSTRSKKTTIKTSVSHTSQRSKLKSKSSKALATKKKPTSKSTTKKSVARKVKKRPDQKSARKAKK